MIARWLDGLLCLGDEVLGINARNLELIYPHNPRAHFHEVDDKLVTKEILRKNGVPTPRTLAIFERFGDLRRLPRVLEEALEGFVVKPADASGGRGILVVRRGAAGRLGTPDRRGERSLDAEQITEHVAQILSGLHGPARLVERAFIEELLEPEETLAALSYRGLPDVRVLLLRCRPLLAMLRLPTRQSAGRANLHQGAVGAGIELESGQTTHAIVGNRSIDVHPDHATPIRGIRVPCWDEVLDLAERAAASVRLGYVGVDLCIDRRQGPLVIEINARPGLNIQLANRTGLRTIHGKTQ